MSTSSIDLSTQQGRVSSSSVEVLYGQLIFKTGNIILYKYPNIKTFILHVYSI